MNIDLNQKGTVMTEIGCIIVLVAIAAVASLGFVGTSLTNRFSSTANGLNDAQDNAGFIPGCPQGGCPGDSPGGSRNNPERQSGYNSSSGPLGGYNPGLGGGNN